MQRGSFSTLAHPFEVLTFLEKRGDNKKNRKCKQKIMKDFKLKDEEMDK